MSGITHDSKNRLIDDKAGFIAEVRASDENAAGRVFACFLIGNKIEVLLYFVVNVGREEFL